MLNNRIENTSRSKPPFVGTKVRLGELCNPKQWKSLKQCDMTEEGYPVYGANGIIGRYSQFNHSSETILIGCRGTCGEINVCQPKSYVTSNAMCLDDLSSRVDMGYLVCFLKAYDFKKVIGGTSQPQITKTGVSSIEIPVFSLEDQLEIRMRLESVQRAIEICEASTERLNDLIKSRFVEMFGDPKNSLKFVKKPIRELASLSSGATPSRKKPEYYEGRIPWVKTSEVAAGNIDSTEEYITEEAVANSACHVLPAGTILIAMYGQGDTRGKAALLTISAATNQACAALEFNEQIDRLFALNQLHLCYEDLRSLSHGGNQKNLSLQIIKDYELIVPPVELQQQYADFVTQVDKSRFVDIYTENGLVYMTCEPLRDLSISLHNTVIISLLVNPPCLAPFLG